jgi:hypothetical protein
MKTVIVLGAGASKSIGFPVGFELVEQIAQKYQDDKFIKILKRILWNNRGIIRKYFNGFLPSGILDQMEGDPYSFLKKPIPELSSWIRYLPGAETIDDL